MTIRPYLTVFRIQALRQTQYRGAALGGMVTQLFYGMVLIAVYHAFQSQTGDSVRLLRETATYVWIQQMFFRGILSADAELFQQIMSGNLAYSLIRPVDQHTFWFMRDLANKLVGSFMRLVPLVLIQPVLPEPFRMLSPFSFLSFAAFLFSLLGGMCLSALVHSFTAAVAMRTLDRRGIVAMINLLMMLFSGNIIPLKFFPDHLSGWMRLQPFAQILDAPIRMYMGNGGMAECFLVQAFWLAVSLCLTRLFWKMNLRRIVIQGG